MPGASAESFVKCDFDKYGNQGIYDDIRRNIFLASNITSAMPYSSKCWWFTSMAQSGDAHDLKALHQEYLFSRPIAIDVIADIDAPICAY